MNKLLENLQTAELAIYDHVGFKGPNYPEIDHPVFDYSEFNWAIRDNAVFYSDGNYIWPEKDVDENIMVRNFCNDDNGNLIVFSGKDLTMFLDNNADVVFDCMVFDNSKRVK
jgi:hypothetical protein